MKYVDPIVVTDAVLTATNVLEASPAAYNAGTTYVLDDYASTTDATAAELITIWQSKQNGNTGNAPAAGVWWLEVSTTYEAWGSGPTFGLGKRVVAGHGVYESLQAGNTNKDPTDLANDAWWGLVSQSNQRAMFDTRNLSATSRAERVDVTLTLPRLANTVAIFMSGATAQVTVHDAGDVLRYDSEEISLRGAPPAAGWYPFWFTRRAAINKLVLTNLPPYAGAKLRVRVVQPGGVAVVNTLLTGMAVQIADGVRKGVRISLVDYSVNGENAFGVTVLTQRDFAIAGDFTLRIPNTQVDAAWGVVVTSRARPGLWIGYKPIGLTVIYGYPKRFEVLIPYENYSDATLKLQGFT